MAYFQGHECYDSFHAHLNVVYVNRWAAVQLVEKGRIDRIVGLARQTVVVASCIVEVVVVRRELVVELVMLLFAVVKHIVPLDTS